MADNNQTVNEEETEKERINKLLKDFETEGHDKEKIKTNLGRPAESNMRYIKLHSPL